MNNYNIFRVKNTTPEKSFAIGRNGTWKVREIEVFNQPNGIVILTPVGTKDRCLNAGMGIPVEIMDELCRQWLTNRVKEIGKKYLTYFDNLLK